MRFILQCFFAALLLLCSAACTRVIPYYKPDIKQGNEITQAQVDQLKKNMTEARVIEILGEPSIQKTFANNRLIYVNTLLTGKGAYTEQRLILSFDKGRLVSGTGDFMVFSSVHDKIS